MTYFVADPTRTLPSYEPPPLPAPTWTPADLGVQLGLSITQAQFVAAAIEAVLVAAVACLAIARLARAPASGVSYVREVARARSLPSNDRMLALGALAVTIATVLVIPYGPGWACAVNVDAGLLVIVAATAVAAVWIALAIGTKSESGSDDGAHLVSRVVPLELAAALAIAGPVLFANGTSPDAVVDGQRALGLPYGVVQPLGLVGFFLATILAVDLLDSASGESLHNASAAGLLLAKVCAGTTAFLGGWWFPGFERLARTATGALGGHGNVSWQYAAACFLIGSVALGAKVAATLAAVGWARRRLRSEAGGRIVAIGRGFVGPIAFLNVVALGGVFVVGLPAGQGGMLGFFETTRTGIVVGSRLFGYGYLLASALASVTLCAAALYVLCGRRTVMPESRS
jgi:hypothetical protein